MHSPDVATNVEELTTVLAAAALASEDDDDALMEPDEAARVEPLASNDPRRPRTRRPIVTREDVYKAIADSMAAQERVHTPSAPEVRQDSATKADLTREPTSTTQIRFADFIPQPDYTIPPNQRRFDGVLIAAGVRIHPASGTSTMRGQ